jgi:subtilisin family serine protease
LVSYGTDLVGDAYNGNNKAVPDPDPIDCGGHGTHVAGIIAAQSNPFGFTGAAPGVTLGAFKVFGCDGQVGNDVLIASYNMAYEAGSDIITASIGGPAGWSEEPWAVAVQRIVEAGVPCTVAAGNEGASGQFYASTAANGKKITAIASVDNTVTPALLIESSYSVAGAPTQDFGWTPGNPDNWAGVALPLYAVSFDTTDPANGCDPFPDSTPDLSGHIVLIRRGTCTFVQKVTNAAAKGAKYVMLYNNVAGAVAVEATVAGIQGIGMTTPTVGAAWIAALKAGSEVVLHMTDPATSEQVLTMSNNTRSGGFLSSYTTWGPTWELDVKPQIAAPGGQILSTYPRAMGGYAVLSGTSMATPLAAGIVALIAQVRKTFDPATIENLLSSTANPQLFNDGTAAYPVLAPIPQQGGGLIQAYEAAYSPVLLSVSSLAFNDTDNFVGTKSFTLKNVGPKDITYSLGNVGAATGYTLVAGTIYADTFPNELNGQFATLAFSPSSVSVLAGGSATVEVTVTPPAGLDASRLPVWSGYISMNGTDGSSLSLPYQGVSGSMHSATVLDTAFLSLSTDEAQAPAPGNSTFILPPPGTAASASAVLPAIVVNLALGSALVRCDVVPMTTCPPNTTTEVLGTKTIGQVDGFPVLWNTRGAFGINWDGELADGTFAPAGKYKFAVKALRIFGKETELKEYDVAESDSFRISYGK